MKGRRIDGVVDVIDVKLPGGLVLDPVRGDEHPTGPEYPGHLGEDRVLGRGSRDVMKHVEGSRAGEAPAGEVHGGGIALHHLHIRPGQASRQGMGEVRIELQCRQVRRLGAQDIGGRPRPGAGRD